MLARAQHLTIGGYGEVALTRNFYSDNVYRYSRPSEYANDPSHGRFDIPHAVLYVGYDFGKGWSMQTEIEFEHTGTGSSVEKEFTVLGCRSRRFCARCLLSQLGGGKERRRL